MAEPLPSKQHVAGSSPAPRSPCCDDCGPGRRCDEKADAEGPAPPPGGPVTHLVASCENRANFAWQACLFAYSALHYAGTPATLVVHSRGGALHPWFDLARERAGARVVVAPSFRGPHEYGPRNTAGTLVALDGVFPASDGIALCDADLIFVAPLLTRLTPGRIVADYYPVVRTDAPVLDEVVAAYGLDPKEWSALGHSRRAGVPYVLEAREALRLGEAWAEAIDVFGRRPFWEAQMTAFAMAAARLKLPIELRRTVHVTYRNDQAEGSIVHYGWRCEGWFKHDYYGPEAPGFWRSCDDRAAAPGTIMDHLFRQVRECRSFYGM